MPYTLDQLNQADLDAAQTMLDGLYEHTPWVATQALQARPFQTLGQLKNALVQALERGSTDAQLALIRAHPELAGKAAQANTLTAESTHEQSQAGLHACSPEELARIGQLNADYNAKFGFPYILCVRGPKGTGLNRQQIIENFAQRLNNPPEQEQAEALKQINLIAEIRLADKFGVKPPIEPES